VKPDIELLVPCPKEARPTAAELDVNGSIGVLVEGAEEQADRAERHLARCLEKEGLKWHRLDSNSETSGTRIILTGGVSGMASPDAYRLTASSGCIRISAARGSGLFNGVSTLAQWIRLHQDEAGTPATTLTGLEVDDRPTFANRGVMLDVSRNKVPTMATLFTVVDQLARWKINQLQLYVEHTFAYSEHETVWRDASPLTAGEIRELDTYCAQRFIELVPNQQSFGHMHRWLSHERYRPLAERPDGVDHPFSPAREPFSLCPTNPGSLALVSGLFDELLPNFSSPLFNVGLDETFDLGTGRSATACEERGREEVYLSYLGQIHRLAKDHGRRIQFWADIALEYPGLIDRLPGDAIALNWGHEADHPFADETSALAKTGLEFYVCPGTSSWSSFAGRADTALRNLKSAAEAGAAHGASGYLVTDWGDHGHLQPLSSSYLGLLAGAALAWNADTDVHPAKPLWQLRLDLHAFESPGSGLGRLCMALGNAYLATGTPNINGTALFHLLLSPHDDLDHGRYAGMTVHRLEVVLAAIGHARTDLSTLGASLPGELVVRELDWVARALALAGQVGIERSAAGATKPIDQLPTAVRRDLLRELNGLVEGIAPLWLARNRPGGLSDSQARLAPLRDLLTV
jgi:hypothetical protein